METVTVVGPDGKRYQSQASGRALPPGLVFGQAAVLARDNHSMQVMRALETQAPARPLRILVAAVHYPVASGRFILRALQRLGHDVKSIGPYTGNNIWGMTVDQKWVWVPDILDQPDQLATLPLGEGVQAALGYWRPDLVITADSAYTILGEMGCPHVLWGQDNHVRDYYLREWDAMFLAHSWGARMGDPNAHWLPPCYDPEVCTDLGLERDLDVLMVGYPYGPRQAILTAIAESGLKAAGGLGPVYDEYNQLYNRAKIAFVKSAAGDVTNRFLENMAQGCCVLADRVRDAEKMGFVAGVDYWPYETQDEAVREAQMLIRTGKWKEIAANGQRKLRGGGHTWDARALRLLETLLA